MNYLKKNFDIIAGLTVGLVIAMVIFTQSVIEEPEVQTEVVVLESCEQTEVIQVEVAEVIAQEEDDFTFIPIIDLDEPTQRMIADICQEYDISFSLVLAMIEKESNCDPDVVSVTGDSGLMQINKINHEWLSEELGVTDFLDIEQNVRSGCFILQGLFEKYQDVDKVLMSYNMGERNAKNLWEQGIYSSKYSEEIVQREEEISQYIDDERMIDNGEM